MNPTKVTGIYRILGIRDGNQDDEAGAGAEQEDTRGMADRMSCISS